MRVEELIKRLSECDPNLLVVVSGYEGGETEVVSTKGIRLTPNSATGWWEGEFETADRWNVADGEKIIPAVKVEGKKH